jgi:predicted kinase
MIFVCGELGSGKTTYASQVAKTKGYGMIEVSDIVKRILGQTERSKLQGHPELDKAVIHELVDAGSDIVVSGARQVSILKAFPSAELVWIEVPEEERYRRLVSRMDNKDPEKTKEAFKVAQQRDQDLGLGEVKSYIMNSNKGRIVHG